LRADGSVDDSRLLKEEPLSADTRVKEAAPREMRFGECRQGARRTTLSTMKLKLVAGMMGVGLDELVQRDAQRRMRKMLTTVAVSAVLLVVLTALGGYGFWANERRRPPECRRGWWRINPIPKICLGHAGGALDVAGG